MEWFELMKDLKEKSGMINRTIAEKSGVPEPTLEKIFSGATRKPGINTVIDIIHAMGGTLDSIDPVAQTGQPKPVTIFPAQLARIIEIYNKMNPAGQDKLYEYAEDLFGNNRYKKSDTISEETVG